MKIIYLLAAEQEMIDAAVYYEFQAQHLGKIFLNIVEKNMNVIRNNPGVAPVIRYNIRRLVIQRFPYAILYKTEKDAIIIIAVMHMRKHPSYWTQRLK